MGEEQRRATEPAESDRRAGEAFARLVAVMRVLRAPGGCPWDAAQDLGTLRPYLVEEAYEVLEAVDAVVAGAPRAADKLREELGDLLLQVVFQARLTTEHGWFDVADVVDAIAQKLWRRHPHVFGETTADSAAGALRNWEAMKAAEKDADGPPSPPGTPVPAKPSAPKRAFDGTPRQAPALLRAFRIGEKSHAIGFDWPDVQDVRAKMNEELLELDRAVAGGDPHEIEHELGDVLYVVAQYARHLHVEPETALRACIDRFIHRFSHVEDRLAALGKTPRESTLEEMDLLWEEAKRLP
jgi:MazG family protein